VRQIDILPTMLELTGLRDVAGVLAEKHFDGTSFAASFAGGDVPERAAFGCEGTMKNTYVRKPPWKYIELEPIPGWADGQQFFRDFFKGRKRIRQLFNIEDDPDEANNLVDRMPKKAHELRAEVFGHKAAMRKKKPKAGETRLDEETLQRLRELGYVQ
jgi:arylsulfatase A-like enzyme